jgi:hypothetical protein
MHFQGEADSLHPPPVPPRAPLSRPNDLAAPPNDLSARASAAPLSRLHTLNGQSCPTRASVADRERREGAAGSTGSNGAPPPRIQAERPAHRPLPELKASVPRRTSALRLPHMESRGGEGGPLARCGI